MTQERNQTAPKFSELATMGFCSFLLQNDTSHPWLLVSLCRALCTCGFSAPAVGLDSLTLLWTAVTSPYLLHTLSTGSPCSYGLSKLGVPLALSCDPLTLKLASSQVTLRNHTNRYQNPEILSLEVYSEKDISKKISFLLLVKDTHHHPQQTSKVSNKTTRNKQTKNLLQKS